MKRPVESSLNDMLIHVLFIYDSLATGSFVIPTPVMAHLFVALIACTLIRDRVGGEVSL